MESVNEAGIPSVGDNDDGGGGAVNGVPILAKKHPELIVGAGSVLDRGWTKHWIHQLVRRFTSIVREARSQIGAI